VVDSKGRAIGLLVAGAGATEETDVTYLTPFWWIEEQMKKVFPNLRNRRLGSQSSSGSFFLTLLFAHD